MWLPKLPEPVAGSARAELEQRWGRARRWVLLCNCFLLLVVFVAAGLVALRLSWGIADLPEWGSKERGAGKNDISIPFWISLAGLLVVPVALRGNRLLNPEVWSLFGGIGGIVAGFGVCSALPLVSDFGGITPAVLICGSVGAVAALLVLRASRVLTRPFFGPLGGSGIRVAVPLRTVTARFWTQDVVWLEADELTIKVASGRRGYASGETKRQVKLSYVLDVRVASAAGDERLWPGLDDARGVFPRSGQGLVVVRTGRAEYELPVDEPREFARAVWLRKQMTSQLVAD